MRIEAAPHPALRAEFRLRAVLNTIIKMLEMQAETYFCVSVIPRLGQGGATAPQASVGAV